MYTLDELAYEVLMRYHSTKAQPPEGATPVGGSKLASGLVEAEATVEPDWEHLADVLAAGLKEAAKHAPLRAELPVVMRLDKRLLERGKMAYVAFARLREEGPRPADPDPTGTGMSGVTRR